MRSREVAGASLNTNAVIENYITARKKQGVSHCTVANLRWTLRNFSAHIGHRRLDRIGPIDIERWLESCANYAPASRRLMFSTVRGFLNWCERRKYVRRNPTNDVIGPRQPKTLPRALATGVPGRVLAACPDARARFIVILMCQQGLRCVEISRLELADIDRYHQTMRVHGKGGHERVLPVMDETLHCLNDYLGEHPCTAGPLVRSYTHNGSLHRGTISHMVSKWMLDAGVKSAPRDGISAHCGRHTCATDMLLAGAHLRDVQGALGHAHLSSTERYLPLVVRGLDDAMTGRAYSPSYGP